MKMEVNPAPYLNWKRYESCENRVLCRFVVFERTWLHRSLSRRVNSPKNIQSKTLSRSPLETNETTGYAPFVTLICLINW